jgi:hypothetical protein
LTRAISDAAENARRVMLVNKRLIVRPFLRVVLEICPLGASARFYQNHLLED